MTLGHLLTWVLPLSLVSALSPMMFLQSSALALRRGVGASLKYGAGQGTILAAIAPVGLGIMGNIAATWAERELASKQVNVVLGLLLFCFAAWVVSRSIVHRRRHGDEKSQLSLPDHGAYVFGLLNGASDYTGIVVFAAISQRTGAAGISLAAKLLVIILSALIILIPAWLPVLLSRIPYYDRSVAKVGPVLSRVALLGTVLSSVVGGAILIVHGLF